MYQSPIEIIQGQLMTEYENGVLKAVQKYDIHCNKEELIKALMYDRNQYEKGYKDRDAEIIRCKDCKNRYSYAYCPSVLETNDDDFCSYAEGKKEK